MAEIPSDIATSAAQAPFQSREILKDRETRRAAQTHAATRQVKTMDDASATVETADADNQVFTNSEGQGSQGRSFDERPAASPSVPPVPDGGIIEGDDGRLHVDLEA